MAERAGLDAHKGAGRYALRVARKAHTCTECGWRQISPGETYFDAACPPWHDANSSGRRWWIIKACLPCARRYGLLTAEQRRALDPTEEARDAGE